MINLYTGAAAKSSGCCGSSRQSNAPPPAAAADTAAGRWCWNPDARLVRTSSNRHVLTNYSNGAKLSLEERDGRAVASVSGLAIAFPWPGDLTPATADLLVRHEFLLPAEGRHEYQARVRGRLAVALERSYGFIIMPTEKCNFRCDYCYESFERGRMSAANADAMSRAIERTARAADSFSLGFFGGEPLLCPDLVARFSAEAFEVMSDRGLPYHAGITTNGSLLTPDLFRELLDVGVVSYQISVDGTRELHDRQRPTAAGRTTFDTILANLRHMARSDADFTCVIRCNVQERDYGRVFDLFEGGELAAVRGDERFVVDVHRIWQSDQTDVPSVRPSPACGSSMAGQLDHYTLNRELSRLGVGSAGPQRPPAVLSASCYAGKRNWFVVGPDLALYKCTVVFHRDENRVGRVNPDGSLAVDGWKNDLWTGSNALTDAGCSTCHYRVPCGGVACPLTRFTDGLKACPDLKSPDVARRWAESELSGVG